MGELSWRREEWAHERTGEESDPAVADAGRAAHGAAVFGQTCPIETAVDVPAWRIKGYDDGVICVRSQSIACLSHRPTRLESERRKPRFGDKNLRIGLRTHTGGGGRTLSE